MCWEIEKNKGEGSLISSLQDPDGEQLLL